LHARDNVSSKISMTCFFDRPVFCERCDIVADFVIIFATGGLLFNG
jgi:hypothetical protein